MILSQVLNGHFVHYFAPKDLPAVPKNVVFVIDTSASMLGKKIRQVRQHAHLQGENFHRQIFIIQARLSSVKLKFIESELRLCVTSC